MEENTNNDAVLTEKEEELLKTIKMEPILETTELKEEETATTKKKKIKITNILLILLIVVLLGVLAFIFLK